EDEVNAELLKGAGHLRWLAAPGQLLGERPGLLAVVLEDAVTVAVPGQGDAFSADRVAQEEKVARGVFVLSEDGMDRVAGGVVDSADKDQLRPSAFQPGRDCFRPPVGACLPAASAVSVNGVCGPAACGGCAGRRP